MNPFVDFERDGENLAENLLAVTPGELDVAAELALETLESPLQEIALLAMEGRTQAEIAERLGCSRRTIVRKLELIRATLSRQLAGDDRSE